MAGCVPVGRTFIACLAVASVATAQEGMNDPDAWSQMRLYSGATWGSVGQYEEYWDVTRIDSVAPAGIPLWRRLEEGQWLLSYRYKHHSFDGMRDGRDDRSSSELFTDGYTSTPSALTAETHTFEFQYGLDDHWNFFVQAPYLMKELDTDLAGGGSRSTETSGIGDIVVGVVRDIRERDDSVLRGHAGLSIPLGSIDERDGGVDQPYPMQLGTGTVDLHHGVTYIVQKADWSWGAHARARVQFYKNSEDYGVSDSGTVAGWVSKSVTESLSGSLRLAFNAWGDYHGENDALNPADDPANDPHRQGGTRFDLFGGINYELGDGYDIQHRLLFELGFPVDEWLDGPGLSTEWVFYGGWQLSL